MGDSWDFIGGRRRRRSRSARVLEGIWSEEGV